MVFLCGFVKMKILTYAAITLLETERECVDSAVGIGSLNVLQVILAFKNGRVMDQNLSSQSYSVEIQVLFQVSPCEICG
jgi:hypothetical protein